MAWHRGEEESIESIKRDMKRIRRSGKSAEALGWLMLLAAAAAVWAVRSKALVLLILGVGAILGLFFVYSGNYLRDGRGRRTKLFLLLNSIISLPLSIAILPLFVCVQSLNNRRRFMELPEKIRGLYSKPKRFHISWWEIILLALALGVGAASAVLKFDHLNKAEHQARVSATPAVPAVDTAAEAHFTINFPSGVSATNLTEQVSGHQVGYTTYVSTGNKGADDYDVYFYHYPDAYFNYGAMAQPALAATIHTSLMTAIQNAHGTLLTSTPATYLGHASEDAQFSCQTLGGTNPGFARVFFINNYEYLIITIGADQNSFNSFANSFQFKT